MLLFNLLIVIVCIARETCKVDAVCSEKDSVLHGENRLQRFFKQLFKPRALKQLRPTIKRRRAKSIPRDHIEVQEKTARRQAKQLARNQSRFERLRKFIRVQKNEKEAKLRFEKIRKKEGRRNFF